MLDHADDGASGFPGVDEHATTASNAKLRSTPKHSRFGVALLGLLAATPAAADSREPVPVAPWALEASFGGYGLGEGEISVSAIGGGVEFAVGHARWQYFVAGFAGYATVDRAQVFNHGFALRGAGGVRWIARSFGFGGEAALELGLEASAGYESTWWHGGTASSRPDLQLGIDWQARLGLIDGHQRTIRFGFLTALAPADNPDQMFACRGSCPMPARRTALSRGLVAHVGYAW